MVLVFGFVGVGTGGGVVTVNLLSLGIVVWAVRCGILGGGDLCEHLGRVGSLLFQLVELCHGPGLVDAAVTGFMRYV